MDYCPNCRQMQNVYRHFHTTADPSKVTLDIELKQETICEVCHTSLSLVKLDDNKGVLDA